MQFFSTVHSIDRLKIARVLEEEAKSQDRTLRAFIQVHLGNESSKHGFRPGELEDAVREMGGLRRIEIVGLMTIPPFARVPEDARRWFQQLREARDRVAVLVCDEGVWPSFRGWLSMGMSDDFEVAVEEGATHVRVGTSIFGSRPPL